MKEPVIIPGGQRHHRLRPCRLHERPRVRRHAGPSRENAHAQRREVREKIESCVYRHHGLVGFDSVTVVQCVDRELRPVLDTELQHRNRFIDSADESALLGRELHRDERRSSIGDEHITRPQRRRVRERATAELLPRKIERRGLETLTPSGHPTGRDVATSGRAGRTARLSPSQPRSANHGRRLPSFTTLYSVVAPGTAC